MASYDTPSIAKAPRARPETPDKLAALGQAANRYGEAAERFIDARADLIDAREAFQRALTEADTAREAENA